MVNQLKCNENKLITHCYLDVFDTASDIMFRIKSGVVQTFFEQLTLDRWCNCFTTQVVCPLFSDAGRCRKSGTAMKRIVRRWCCTVWWCNQVSWDVWSVSWVRCRTRIVSRVRGAFASNKRSALAQVTCRKNTHWTNWTPCWYLSPREASATLTAYPMLKTF